MFVVGWRHCTSSCQFSGSLGVCALSCGVWCIIGCHKSSRVYTSS